jgi:hypothetical protein
MTSPDLKNGLLIGIAAILVVCVVYQYDSTLFGLLGSRREGFEAHDMNKKKNGFENGPNTTADGATMNVNMPGAMPAAMPPASPPVVNNGATAQGFKASQSNGGSKEGFADLASMEGPAAFASAEAPAGCYPRDQLTPTELLPADQNTIYAQQNPMGVGSLKGKNFLSAGALIGVNTVGQSLRNANLQIRSEPPNPQVPVSIFFQSTIGPDISHRPLEVGS